MPTLPHPLDYAPPKPHPRLRKALRWAIRLTVLLSILIASWAVFRAAVYVVYPPVPARYMWIFLGDVAGEATFEAEHFRLTFVGRAFADGHITGGNYLVDHRYSTFMPWNPPIGTPPYTYSDRTRIFSINYAGKRFDFSLPNQTLTVDGATYSTATAPVHLRIDPAGRVSTVPLTPPVLLPPARATRYPASP